MDEKYVTYVDDEHVDNHDYDDNTDDDHDNNNGLAWSGPVRPGSGPGPARVRSGNIDIILIIGFLNDGSLPQRKILQAPLRLELFCSSKKYETNNHMLSFSLNLKFLN